MLMFNSNFLFYNASSLVGGRQS